MQMIPMYRALWDRMHEGGARIVGTQGMDYITKPTKASSEAGGGEPCIEKIFAWFCRLHV